MLVSRCVKQQLEGEEMEMKAGKLKKAMEGSNPAKIKHISQYLFNLVKVVQDFGVRDRSRLDLFGGLGCLVICFKSEYVRILWIIRAIIMILACFRRHD